MQSLPSWERGLKFEHVNEICDRKYVAPLVGAWIEIIGYAWRCRPAPVAPLVGAWIEILDDIVANGSPVVAPLVGAWIEIN